MRSLQPRLAQGTNPRPRAVFRLTAALLAATLATISAAHGWTPGTAEPAAVAGFEVDTSDRTDVLAFFHTIYGASEGYAERVQWTGDVAAGEAGTTSETFKDDVLRRINFYRALAHLPASIAFDPDKNSGCQSAALMMSANRSISHNPPTSWIYYSVAGAQAAGHSNLALGVYGPDAIDAYMVDAGTSNRPVGHRRWLLYSRARAMGTGDIPRSGTYPAANCNWVIGDFEPAGPGRFVAWPGAGYFPHDLLPARWSLGFAGADFSAASVSMTRDGEPLAVKIVSRTDNGYGENTLVWEPQGLESAAPQADTMLEVTVSGIAGAGVPASVAYAVSVFDPTVLGHEVTIAGPELLPLSGQRYDFAPIAQADRYELRVSRRLAEAWLEGAEDATAALVTDRTSESYPLRQADVRRTGDKAFHLTLASFAEPDQVFEIDRDLIPGPASRVLFHDLMRYVTTATRLTLDVSTDGGANWTTLWTREGRYDDSGNGEWDSAFNARSVSLAEFAGRPMRLRFALRKPVSGAAYIATGPEFGVFVDDVSVTDTATLSHPHVTALAGTSTSFQLDADTAGAPLESGADYYLRIRPEVGTRWFGDGPTQRVTARSSVPVRPALRPLAVSRSTANQAGTVVSVAVNDAVKGRFLAYRTDAATGTMLPTVPLTSLALVDFASLPDLGGDGVDELGFLEEIPGSDVFFRIRNGTTGEVLRRFRFDSVYRPYWMRTLSGAGVNGGTAIAVLGVDGAGRSRVELRDMGTGSLLRRVAFGADYAPLGFEVVADLNANGSPEFALIGVDAAGRLRAPIRDSSTGEQLFRVRFTQTLTDPHVAGLDLDGDGAFDALAVVGRNEQGSTRAEVRSASGQAVGAAQFSAAHTVMGVTGIPDMDASGAPELAVLQVDADGNARVQIRDSLSGTAVGIVAFPGMREPRVIDVMPDVDGNAAPELVCLGETGDGSYLLQVRDAVGGSLVEAVELP